MTKALNIYCIEGALLGAFMISACVFTAVLEHPASPLTAHISSDFFRRALIGVAMGVTAVGLIYSPWGKRSGAHMNPAVTLCFLWLGNVRPKDAAGYMVAQLLGGITGVAMAVAALGNAVKDPHVNYVVTLPGTYGPWAAWFGEYAISLGLMAAVLASNSFPWLRGRTGWIAGSLVAVYITFEAPVSGMSMNPARTFSSALAAGVWTGLWVYFTAPVLGMLTAVELYRVVTGKSHRLICGKFSHCKRTPCVVPCNCGGNAGI